ncbi:MAG: hypothetical protein JO165_12045 [Candidatus Eremiobacteraeota bacterium]|nr:hypothetical protein [Candidatus Eremiobacteraeota bacterium]
MNDRLARATQFPVTIVTAPAGFGKSLALSDFIESARLDAVRYEVRREDRTLVAFLRGLSEALEPVVPSALGAFPQIQTRLLASSDPVREAADWLAEHLRRTLCTIVIDDMHYAAEDPDATRLLSELVERTSGRINWIIATRSDVGLPVASWVAYGRMDMPITEDDLRFTLDEALAAAEDAQEIPTGEIAALRELTGGWPVALTFALRSHTNSRDLAGATSGAREMLYRYLAEQVFSRLAPSERELLLRTSVYPWIDADIAQRAGAGADALDELRRNATFINEVSAGSYKYHDLFRDFLETQLQRQGDRAFKSALTAAGETLLQREHPVDAMMLFIRAGETARVLDMLDDRGFELFEVGEAEVLTHAFEAVDEAELTAHPCALALRATIDANTGNFERANRRFTIAIENAADRAERLRLAHRYGLELVRRNLPSVEFLESYAFNPQAPPESAVALRMTLATSYEQAGRYADASKIARESLSMLDPAMPQALQARVYQQAAYVAFYADGDTASARKFASEAVRLAIKHQLYEIAARAYSVQYNVAYEEDDVVEALSVLDHLAEAARKGGSLPVRAFAAIAAYELEVERANDAAIARLDDEIGALDRIPDVDVGIAREQREDSLLPAFALRAAWNGDFTIATSLLKSSVMPTVMERKALREAELAVYAAGAGDHETCDAAIAGASETFEEVDAATRRGARARLLVSVAASLRGHSSTAKRFLHEVDNAKMRMPRISAFANAVRGLIRTHLGETDANANLAVLERLRAVHAGGLARMLEKLPSAGAEVSGFAMLTPAEREILRLLVDGASSKDIAVATGRSPHTVDTHIRSLCRKLGCSGRREAVALATGQGWVFR